MLLLSFCTFLGYWHVIEKGGEKEIVKLLQCDNCEKNVSVESSYELKLRNPETRLTKNMDLCHNCAKEKGVLDLMATSKWKQWNQATKQWTTPE